MTIKPGAGQPGKPGEPGEGREGGAGGQGGQGGAGGAGSPDGTGGIGGVGGIGGRGAKGDTGATGARGRGPRPILQFVAFGAVVVTSVIANILAVSASERAGTASDRAGDVVHRLAVESADRRSQTCVSFESAHKQEVDSLRVTYRYLLELPSTERNIVTAQPLNKAVLRNLPQLERNAKNDTDTNGIFVPPYCDQRGVGLPEPDPVVPKRPKGL